ncbi:hypothetical protein IQ268_17635 [Oculatella sp. LEGE 06141]|uniref:hypothetical protein n=1 Tax=Oculatella sp. LEGE 06141 TaxID=1828648 RepID=UPI00187E8A2E|nr:hypothetical protein [Oculatella sp. LEGE 06141]MBE9180386.1 hypothetical protein [Oculatella sp. LEGE 06141]
MKIVVCPGIHSLALTQRFLTALAYQPSNILVFPAESEPAYSPIHILNFLSDALKPPDSGVDNATSTVPLVFIGFSAGVVGAIAAARAWQRQGGVVNAFIALDGWGVPLYANFPIHRVSHDYFTHWSSAWLGNGEDSFYADPPVEHLEVWRSPQTVHGYWLPPARLATRHPTQRGQLTTAAQFLNALLDRYSTNAAT